MRTIAVAAALAASSLSLAGCRERQGRPGIPPRQVLLVTIDALRADHVSAWGHDVAPRWDATDGGVEPAALRGLTLDALAEEGVSFARAFAPSTVAAASLAAIHTGRSPLETGVLEAGDLPDGERTLAEILHDAGFDTRAFVTRGATPLGDGWKQGFASYEEHEDDLATTQRALAWSQAHDHASERRTFVWLHLAAPAYPYEPGALSGIEFARLFADPSYDGPARGDAEFRASGAALDQRDRAHLVALYDAEVARTCVLLRGLVDQIAYEGAPADAWARTLLVVAGLGGETLAPRTASELGRAARPDESVLHVPLFVRHPDSLTGRRVFAALVTLEDLCPTLCEWMDVAPPERASGASLLSLTDEWRARPFPRRTLVALAPGGGDASGAVLAARDERWRAIVWPAADGGAERVELYDLARDPRARTEVAARHPDVAVRLREELRAACARLDLAASLRGAPWLE